MAIKQISHIAIAVTDLEQQVAFYRDVLGLPLVCREEVADQKVKVAMFQVGEARIELMESTAPDGPVGKFVAKRGEGIHHIAYEVDDLPGSLRALKDKGVRLIDEKPRGGAHGAQIAFVHPKSTFGVLTELCREGRAENEGREGDER